MISKGDYVTVKEYDGKTWIAGQVVKVNKKGRCIQDYTVKLLDSSNRIVRFSFSDLIC